MQVELRDSNNIKRYRNPRHNGKAVVAVAAFGFHQPLVADEEGMIIVVDTRLEAAKKLGGARPRRRAVHKRASNVKP